MKGYGSTRPVKHPGYPVYTIRLLIITVITQLVEYINKDEQTAGKAYRQTSQVDKGSQGMSPEVPDRYFYIVEDHISNFIRFSNFLPG
jgi:hypothetical protein